MTILGILGCRSVSFAQHGSVPLDPRGHISYFIDAGTPGSGYQAGDSDLATWALREWERNSRGFLQFERTSDEAEGLLRLYWLPRAATNIGQAGRFMSQGRIRAMVVIRPNMETWPETVRTTIKRDPLLRDTIVYLICLHEIGHALGLAHSSGPDDVMREGETASNVAWFQRFRPRVTARAEIPTTPWLSSNDVARLNSLNSQREQR
ncbi:MAG TPA: matrixin family metalloprotease [Vicinamibacterales bacterium]